MRYTLYYWTGLQGRGEFVRLALEDAAADYQDIAREQGDAVLEPFLQGRQPGLAPFAPPFLKAGRLLIAQTANILHFLGPRLSLVPRGPAAKAHALQLQLTIADAVTEVHDTHHPIASGLYYEEQKTEARRRARDFREQRLPKFLDYFENALQHAGGRHVLGSHSYVDLSLFQLMRGLEYAFPHTMHRQRARTVALRELAERIEARPRIAAYLASPRRQPFNQYGIFRHYPELEQDG